MGAVGKAIFAVAVKVLTSEKNSGPFYSIQCQEMCTVEAYKAKAIVEIGQLIRA